MGHDPPQRRAPRPATDSGKRCAKCGHKLTGLPEPRCPECQSQSTAWLLVALVLFIPFSLTNLTCLAGERHGGFVFAPLCHRQEHVLLSTPSGFRDVPLGPVLRQDSIEAPSLRDLDGVDLECILRVHHRLPVGMDTRALSAGPAVPNSFGERGCWLE